MKENKSRQSLLQNGAVQSLAASLLCILLGLLAGYVVLLIINPAGAWGAITTVLKNFWYYPGAAAKKYFGSTLVKAAPLLMCALSVLFAYKVGLEEHVHQIQADPVEHDAGDDLVDIAVRLQRAGDGPQQSPGGHRRHGSATT